MLRRSYVAAHRSGRRRSYIVKDASLSYGSSAGGVRTMMRSGLAANSSGRTVRPRVGHANSTEGTMHAFPMLTHTDFGYNDQSNNTKWIELANYMPKRNKGLPPWWRGADTYSPLYSEQGRYEYQRYLMLSRFPSDYKKYFQASLSSIRGAGSRSYKLPQEALHWLLRMVVDNFHPQHVHYQAAMQVLMNHTEFDMARDVWRVMERQQTMPDDKLIATYLELCALAGEKTWAFECWNRYCSEKRFLAPGEADPKPVSRTPFTLNRDETLYLPKWKKHFDHDPNLDVSDLNRFNTTRNIYRWMALSMLRTGETAHFEHFFSTLEAALLSTPTPVPEPPNQHLLPKPLWGASVNDEALRPQLWRPTRETLGKAKTTVHEPHVRFMTNEQFLVRCVADVFSTLATSSSAATGIANPVAFADKMLKRLEAALGPKRFDAMDINVLLQQYLRLRRVAATTTGAALLVDVRAALAEKQKRLGATVALHPAWALEVLRGFADECATGRQFDPKAVVRAMSGFVRELAGMPSFEWSADHHLEIVRVLSRCGTMAANDYFVTNVLRQFPWSSSFCEALYDEYRRHDDADMWAELTKRMLVWTERYDVTLSEECKRKIEADYDTIKVQVRSFRDVVVFAFRDAAEKKEAKDPASQLPNPFMDYVSHALPFPDRDTGYPNEYGDIGQWRHPDAGIKGPEYYAPAMPSEQQRGYTSEWRENTATARPVKMPAPWDRKYAEYNRGKHPSYDGIYAGPFPEVFPARMDFRRKTRWDFQSVEAQSKYKFIGPW